MPLTASTPRLLDRLAHARDEKSLRKGLGILSTGYARGLTANSEDPTQIFTRFALAGFDVKGAVSSGAAQVGFGVELALSTDLGTLVLPGVVRIPVQVGANTARTNYTMLAVTRTPGSAAGSRPPSPGSPSASAAVPPGRPAPRWSSSRPIVAMTLTGTQWQAGVNASAGVLVALGNPASQLDLAAAGTRTYDELSIGFAVVATTDSTWTCALLVDKGPLSFATQLDAATAGPGDSIALPPFSLADYVNVMLVGDVQRRVAAWLAETVFADDAVGTSVRTQPALGALEWLAAKGWSKLQTQVVEPEIDPGGAMSAFVAWVRSRVSTDKTDKLVAELTKVKEAFEANPPPATATGPERERYRGMVAAATRFIVMLQAARFRAALGGGAVLGPVPGALPSSQDAPVALLRIVSNSYSMNATVAAGFTLPKSLDTKGTWSQLAGAGADMAGKYVSFRFQAVNTSTPTRFVLTQDTAIDQTVVTLKSPLAKGRGYGALSYRSATAYWVDDDPGKIVALPCGTGASFGVSIDAARLGTYATFCAAAFGTIVGKTKDLLKPAPTGSDLLSVETLLVTALHVSLLELRLFLLDYPFVVLDADPGLGDDDVLEDTAVIVEAGFAATDRVSFTPDPKSPWREPAPLLDAPLFTERVAATPTTPAKLSTLEVMRVRYRKRRDAERTKSLLQIGWEKAFGDEGADDQEISSLFVPAAAGPPTLQVSGGINRIERLAVEGIVDLHVRLFPGATEPSGNADLDQVVPPVALFAQ